MKKQRSYPSWIQALLAGCWLLSGLGYAPAAACDDSARLRQVMLAEDVSARAELDEVLAGQLPFHPIKVELPANLGSTDSAFWLRIRLENTGDQAVTRWLVIGPARLRHVSLFEPKDGRWQETRGGMAEPFSNRAIPTLSQTFELDLPPHSTREVLARVASETTIMIKPGLWKAEQFMLMEQKHERMTYFISGMLLLTLVLGLLLALLAHELAFLVFGLSAMCYTLFFWGFSGLAYRELWPDSPEWALHSISIFETLSAALLLVLHRILLKTPRYLPRLDRVVVLLIACFLLLAALMALTPYYRILVLLMKLAGLVIAIGSPVLGYYASRQGVPLCGYGYALYTLPWQVSTVYYFASINWLPPLPRWPGLYGVPSALLLSTVFILYGLADQLNRARRAHELMEQRQREVLEGLVMERTIELQQAKTLAEHTLEEQRQFLAMVSHEVRSPLANIKTAAQLLELRAKDEESIDILGRILRGAHRLTQFFDNYLTFDRLNTRQWVLSETRVDLPALLQTLYDHYARIATHHVYLSLAPEVIKQRWLRADAQLLSVLLDNLVENALKYSPAGSTVALSAHIGEDDDLRLAVSDQGIGIAADELDLVFNKFFRSTQVGRVVGAGLGLYLVRRIARLHGGSIKLESRQGKGTTAVLTLPQQRWIYE
jgi:signal transduction histidine kinase